MIQLQLELLCYLSLAVACGVSLRIYRAKKNAIFYHAKSGRLVHKQLIKYYLNIHKISGPANYLQQAIFFFLVFALLRTINYDVTWWLLIKQVSAAALLAIGQSTLASNAWQIWINRGSSLPDYDNTENPESENFLFGRRIAYNTWFNGKNKRWLIVVGLVECVFALIAIYQLF